VTSIYTKTGDGGETGLFGGGRVAKDHPRVDAYGEVDELNAAIGVARSLKLDPELDALLLAIQAQLFTLGSVLATPPQTKAKKAIPKIQPAWSEAMELAIDKFDRELPSLRQFILPGGTPAASALHLARTICRRAERRVVALAHANEVEPKVLVYLNRLSDLLFTMARISNHRAGVPDIPWSPPTAG
jgi:cob(I)alamin adenosyltransferase